MKYLKLFFRYIAKRIKTFFIHLYIRYRGRNWQLQKAVRRAKRLHRKDGRRYRVFFFGYRYHVWNRDDIRKRIKSGLFRDGLKAGSDFNKVCFFDTDTLMSVKPFKSQINVSYYK